MRWITEDKRVLAFHADMVVDRGTVGFQEMGID